MLPEIRKILVITYDFYPDSSPNTYRWLNILKSWAESGVEVFVVSAKKNQLNTYEMVDGINIYRTGESFIGQLKYKFNSTNVSVVQQNEPSGLLGSMKKILRKVYENTWSKVYWPDYAFMWQFSAYPLARKIIIKNNIENIISVSWPFTGHLI